MLISNFFYFVDFNLNLVNFDYSIVNNSKNAFKVMRQPSLNPHQSTRKVL